MSIIRLIRMGSSGDNLESVDFRYVIPRLACWRGELMGPIFDRREAVMGLSPWPRTVCQRVGERWYDGAGCMLTSGIRPHRDLHACWRGELMGPIFDRRETVMGLSPWPRTLCQRVGERWCDGAGCMLTSGIRSHRDLQACWRGESMGPIFDRREAVMGLSPWPRTVCQGVGERWCDGAGCLLTSGIR